MQPFFLTELLEAIVGLLTGLISIRLCLGEQGGLRWEGERRGDGWLVEQSEHTQHLSVQVPCLLWVHIKEPKAIRIVLSKTADHRSPWQYDGNENLWHIARTTRVWPRDVKRANAVGKMVPVNLLNARLPQTFQSLIKSSAIKRCMPVYVCLYQWCFFLFLIFCCFLVFSFPFKEASYHFF